MSTLLDRDTTAGLLTCKSRRLESEQQSGDLSRHRNLCVVFAVVIHDLETDRGSVWRRNRLDWDKYLREMRHNHFRSMFRMSHASFLSVLVTIGTFMDRDVSQSEKDGGYISPSIHLDMSLRYLAEGSIPLWAKCHVRVIK
jgi:hypothetical protein